MITAKGWELDDSFVKSVQATRGGSNTKIHTVSIGGGSEALERVAKACGGQFKSVSPGELREFAEQ
jgi:hypothetical protein